MVSRHWIPSETLVRTTLKVILARHQKLNICPNKQEHRTITSFTYDYRATWSHESRWIMNDLNRLSHECFCGIASSDTLRNSSPNNSESHPGNMQPLYCSRAKDGESIILEVPKFLLLGFFFGETSTMLEKAHTVQEGPPLQVCRKCNRMTSDSEFQQIPKNYTKKVHFPMEKLSKRHVYNEPFTVPLYRTKKKKTKKIENLAMPPPCTCAHCRLAEKLFGRIFLPIFWLLFLTVKW